RCADLEAARRTSADGEGDALSGFWRGASAESPRWAWWAGAWLSMIEKAPYARQIDHANETYPAAGHGATAPPEPAAVTGSRRHPSRLRLPAARRHSVDVEDGVD